MVFLNQFLHVYNCYLIAVHIKAAYSCGGVFYTNSGEITSPNYPSNYDNNLRCQYIIRASRGLRITFKLLDAQFETSSCRYDFLSFQEKNTGLGIYCKTGITIYSNENELKITLRTDTSYTFRGFKGRWYSCSSNYVYNNGCVPSIMLNGNSGFLTSPNYPLNYQNTLNISYRISLTVRKRIQIEVIDAEFWRSDCADDYLQFKEGLILSQKYCRSGLIFKSQSHILDISLITDKHGSRKGFKAKWSSFSIGTCGGTFEKETGYIASPNYPSNYDNNLFCQYFIRVPIGKKIVFEILDAKFENTYCGYDFLTIKENQKELGKYCKSGIIIHTTGNELTVQLSTDGSVTKSGFYAHWYSVELHTVCQSCSTKLTNRKMTSYLTYLSRSTSLSISSIEASKSFFTQTTTLKWVSYITSLVQGVTSSKSSMKTSQSVYDPSTDLPQSIAPSMSRVEALTNVFDSSKNLKTALQLTSFTHSIAPSISRMEPITSVFPSISTSLILVDSKLVVPTMSSIASTSKPVFPSISTSLILVDSKLVVPTMSSIASTSKPVSCGGIFQNGNGYFSSPNYPSSYDNNLDCTYLIRVIKGKRITLKIIDAEFETNNCDHDFLKFEERGWFLGEYCKSGNTIYSSGNELSVNLITDYSKRFRGFYAKWYSCDLHSIFENGSCVPSISFHGVVGTITSPNYPFNYQNNLNITYQITVSEGKRIQCITTDFDIEPWTACKYDYLLFKENQTTLGKFCKGKRNVSTSGNTLKLIFVTDKSKTDKGFIIHWKAFERELTSSITGATLSEKSIKETNSPSISKFSPGPRSVLQSLTSYSGLHSNTIELHISSNSKSYGTIIPVLTSSIAEAIVSSNLMKESNGRTKSKILPASHSVLPSLTGSSKMPSNTIIELHTSSNSKNHGTTLPVRTSTKSLKGEAYSSSILKVTTPLKKTTGKTVTPAECGGTFNADSGTLTSPNYPSNYDNNMNCTYIINVQNGKTINFEILNGHFENPSCLQDYLLFKENYTDLGKYCKTGNVILTKGNQLTIYLITDQSVTGKGFFAKWSSLSFTLRASSSSARNSKKLFITIGVSILSASIIILLVACLIYRRKKKDRDYKETENVYYSTGIKSCSNPMMNLEMNSQTSEPNHYERTDRNFLERQCNNLPNDSFCCTNRNNGKEQHKESQKPYISFEESRF